MTLFIPGNSATTLLLLHGSGGHEHVLVPIAHRLDENAALLSIPGRIMENDQRRYFKHLPDGGFDLEDLAVQTQWLIAAVHTEMAEHHRDLRHLVVVGYSNGANIAARACLSGPVPWRTGVFFHAQRLGGEVLTQRLDRFSGRFPYGTKDPLVSEANFHSLINMFQGCGATTTVFTHQRGHRLTAAEVQAAHTFLTQ